MLVNIDNEIMKLIGPLTVDKKEIEDSVNIINRFSICYLPWICKCKTEGNR